MPQSYRDRILLVVMTAAVLFFNLGGPRLWDRDEPRNAGCAAEMLQRGDWVTPVFNGELRSHKPVLIYWLMMSAYSVWGVNEFAARIWSAALGAATVWLTFGIARRLFDERSAVWSAVSLTTMAMFVVASRAATPDATLVFFCTAAMAVYVAGAFPSGSPSHSGGELSLRWSTAAGMFGLMSFAVLAKGPVGMVLPTAVIGMYLLWRRLPEAKLPAGAGHGRRLAFFAARLGSAFAPRHFLATCWSMRPLTAIAMVALIALPWYAWVGLRTDGAWLEGFFLQHNLGRVMRPMEGHGGSFWYYPAALLAGTFPWSLLLPATVRLLASGKATAEARPGLLLAICWIAVYLGLFSLARTKLPSYITPCYPAVALLIGWFCARCEQGLVQLPHRWARVAFAVLSSSGVAILVAVPLAARQLLPGLEILGLLGLIPLLGGLIGLRFASQARARPMLVSFAATAAVMAVAIFGLASEHVDRQRGLEPLLSAIEAQGPEASLAVFECLEPSWIFYTRRKVHLTRVGAVAEAPAVAHAPPVQPQWHDVAQYLASSPRALLITRSDKLGLLRDHVGVDWEIVAQTPFFLRRGRDLIVLRALPPKKGALGPVRSSVAERPMRSPRLY